ncbi:hypothetical protein KIN20_006670 [Parelaphostrongylus tenuis]|uniref:Uncharacterized protein n=1 Tax=Parelaphostrongylus tenuis TaxID=148309 RepID=A0AAD5M240_PARTN|nr:hypothetical protein KIN20_006670 [Parelaphostrongylus tenuis]
MTLAAAAMLKLDHRYGRLSRSRETNGICAGVRTISEDEPFKYQDHAKAPQLFKLQTDRKVLERCSFDLLNLRGPGESTRPVFSDVHGDDQKFPSSSIQANRQTGKP